MTREEAEAVILRGIQLQDEIGRIQYARDEGRKEGRKEALEEGRIDGACTLAMLLLKNKFGELTGEINSKVEGLSLSDLRALTETIFELNSLEDLLNWLSDVESR